MRISINEAWIERTVARRRTYLRAAAGWLTLALLLPAGFRMPAGFGFGLTWFMILNLGIYGAALRRWRTEPGLWMLATFLALFLGACWCAFMVERLRTWGNAPQQPPRPQTWAEIGYAIDASIALVLFGRVVWFAASVAVANWVWTRPVLARSVPLDPRA